MRILRYIITAIILVLPFTANATGNDFLDSRTEFFDELIAGMDYVPGEVMVMYENGRFGAVEGRELLDGYIVTETFRYRPVAVVEIGDGSSIAQAMARLEMMDGVESVSPNYMRYCSFTPDDPLLDRQYFHVPIKSEEAWDVTVGSPSINVAIIDTGLDVEHPEFAGRVVYKENFFDPEVQGATNVFDDSGHGTAVAGIICSEGNNQDGIAGVAWQVNIMAFRACGGPDLSCSLSNEVKAIDSAVANGAHVINLSLGGQGTNSAESNAIANAYNAGVVIVAASGNGEDGGPGILFESSGDPGQDLVNMYYPAAFSQVMGVAALDNENGTISDAEHLERAGFSNYGEDIVSVAAVGTKVYTTTPYRPRTEVPYAIYLNRNYSRLSGTSFACPQVAGVACLVKSLYPLASPLEVRNLIEQSAYPKGGPDADVNGIDDYLGYGVLDAAGAVGNPSAGNGIFENSDFLTGITPSPLFADEIYVVVRCKNGSDAAPLVSYFVHQTSEGGAVTMEALPAHANTWLGKFVVSGSGKITVQINGVLGGIPLQNLKCEYFLDD